MEVMVRVRPDRMNALRQAVGDRPVEAATRSSEPDPAGWTRLRLTLDWPDEVPGRLLVMGADLEVLAPAEIRTGLVDTAKATLERYADSAAV